MFFKKEVFMTFQVELKDGRQKDATKRRLGTSCLSSCFLTVFDPATIIGQAVRHDVTWIFWSRLQHHKCSHEVKGESVTVKVKPCHDSSAEVTTGSVQRGSVATTTRFSPPSGLRPLKPQRLLLSLDNLNELLPNEMKHVPRRRLLAGAGPVVVTSSRRCFQFAVTAFDFRRCVTPGEQSLSGL